RAGFFVFCGSWQFLDFVGPHFSMLRYVRVHCARKKRASLPGNTNPPPKFQNWLRADFLREPALCGLFYAWDLEGLLIRVSVDEGVRNLCIAGNKKPGWWAGFFVSELLFLKGSDFCFMPWPGFRWRNPS
ncbi:MAG: hypothetical protein MRY76_15325, partial [Pseudomonadales bacterium]|nr:hypothetical protein [Pseudomonadales bacterium]